MGKLNPRLKKHYKPQTTIPGAEVIIKINKWTVEAYPNLNTHKISYAISDGFVVVYPVVYENGKVAYDDPYSVPRTVINWFENFVERKLWERRI